MQIILKVDDFWGKINSGMFMEFLDFISDNKIKISLGIIGEGLSKANDGSIKFIRDRREHIEPFNHSYYHLLNPHIISEFYNTSKKYQYDSIDKTSDVIASRLGAKTEVIGFVANSFDNVTVDVLQNFKKISHIYALEKNDLFDLLSSIGKKIIVVNDVVCIERDGKVINFEEFKNGFNMIKSNRLSVFQMHPSNWGMMSFQEFKLIIKFLQDNGCEFIFPTEL